MSIGASSPFFRAELVQQYQRNLTELERHQPEVAALLHQTVLPENITLATGRDGCPTFRISQPDSRKAWFGGSSMPSISAPGLLAEIPKDGGSVILPAIMTGREALVLLDRLPRHAAVFVVEHQPANLLLALHLYDYVDALQSGRLVLISVDLLAETMRAFWTRYPGYEMPTRMVTSPLIPQVCVSQVQQLISEVAVSVFHIQGETIRGAQQQLNTRRRHALPDRPRVAMIDAGRADGPSDRTAGLAAALCQLDWPHVVCTADLPRQCHVAGALDQVAAFQPEVALLLNGFGARWVEHLPRDLPVISWFLPEASVEQATPVKPLDAHLIFASSGAQRDALAERGVPRDRVALCMDGIMSGVTTDPDLVGAGNDGGPESSVIVAPTIDDRPQTLNVTLPSHVRLWQRLRELARAGSETGPRDTAEWVRQAMGDVGMTADDDAAIRFFAQAFEERIGPAHQIQSALTELQRGDPSAVVRSPEAFRRWAQNSFRAAPQCRVGTAHQPILRAAPVKERQMHSLAVFPCDFNERFACILGALANGIVVVVREVRNKWERDYPGTADLLPAIFFFQSRVELMAAMQSAAQVSSEQREKIAHDVHANHTMTNRLEYMVTLLRSSLEPSPCFI